MSEMMKVVEIREFGGGPEALHFARRPVPEPGPGEVRVRVRASGVNRADILQRLGRYPPPPGYPEELPGLEYAGKVEATGASCRMRKIGDAVMGIVVGGAYAEAVIVPERETIRLPRGMSYEEAGAVPEAFLTAWDALVGQAAVSPGEKVLIHAVGSGVGTAALQLARAVGAWTVGTSRTPRKVERALELGLDLGIVVAKGSDWVEKILEAVGELGVDVVIDLVGGTYLEGNQRLLARGARWMVVGVPGGTEGKVGLRTLMDRRASMRGTVLRPRPQEERAVLARAFERLVIPLFEQGKLGAVIHDVLPIEAVRTSHRRLEANEPFGKLVLSWSDG